MHSKLVWLSSNMNGPQIPRWRFNKCFSIFLSGIFKLKIESVFIKLKIKFVAQKLSYFSWHLMTNNFLKIFGVHSFKLTKRPRSLFNSCEVKTSFLLFTKFSRLKRNYVTINSSARKRSFIIYCCFHLLNSLELKLTN